MSKPKSYKRLITSDFEEKDQELVEKLGLILNDSFNELYYALNGRIDLTNNIFCSVRVLDIIVDANGIPTSRTTFSLNSTAIVVGCQVLAADNQTNSATYPSGAPFINFTQIDQAILINHITGLQANQRYTIRVVAYN